MTNSEKCGLIIAQIKANHERPGIRPLTSNEMRERENRRHYMAAGLRIAGQPVRKEYGN